jgi:hypothetical protein
VRCPRLRLFFYWIIPSKKMERFPVGAAIQDTDEPSSDRLIEEGRPLLRRPSFFARILARYPRWWDRTPFQSQRENWISFM